jgi:hypothetical protein
VSYDPELEKSIELDLEREASVRLNVAIQMIRDDLHWYWRWGDGQGGYVLQLLREAVVDCGLTWPHDPKEALGPQKDKIGRALAKRVFERDAYRCVTCGTHIDLCCDHIKPESKGGETTFANLQTMCRPCNSKKGAREE